MAHRQREYFALLPMLSREFAAAVMERFKGHLQDLKDSHRHERMRRAWCMYYSKARDGGWDDTEVQAAGPNGETTLIRPNEYRNLIQHQLNLVTQSPPGFECEAINSDSDSFADAIRGNGILDYYLRVHHLDDIRVETAEIAIVLGEAHLHARWDPAAGNEYAVKEEPVMEDDGETPKMREATPDEVGAEVAAQPANSNVTPAMVPETVQVPVHEGEFVFSVATPYDVAYDPMARDKNRPRWKIICEAANRWDLAAQFPDQRQSIMDAEPYSKHVSDVDGVFCKSEYQHDDYIAIYYVYVEKSPAVRTGREAIVLDDRTVLTDGPLSEDRIPSFRLAPSNVIFQSGGYTNNFDLMPLQEVYSAQYSTVLSNHTAFGKQWVTSPKGTNVKPHHLNRGLGLLEYDSLPGNAPPQALSLLASQDEHITFLDVIRATMERYAVIPANMRGEGTKGDSGAKEALIHATAQQFASSFHRALARLDEDYGTHLIVSLESHATTKRVATIVGRYSSYSTVEFTGQDLQKIARVTVRAADAMRDTPHGREIMADKLMQFPDGIVSMEQYITFMETGRTEPMYESTRDELMCIRRENEQLRDGKPVVFSKLDKHSLHIREHKGKTGDKAVREDPVRLKMLEDHIAQHIAALDPSHPEFAGLSVLLTIGEKPLPMPPPAAPFEGDPGQPANNNGGPPPGKPKPANDQTGSAGAEGKPAMPRLPVNPATGERAPGAVPPPPRVAQQ
jgi:hypothetical protein